MLDVICTGKQDLFQYPRRYMAHLIQRPGERPEVALVLRGGQGAGKNTFVETLGRLVGKYFKEVSAMQQLTGRFNAHLMQIDLDDRRYLVLNLSEFRKQDKTLFRCDPAREMGRRRT